MVSGNRCAIFLLFRMAFEHLVGILELGHAHGVSHIGHLDVAKPGQDQLFGQPYLGVGRDVFFFVSEAVADGNVTHGNLLRIVHLSLRYCLAKYGQRKRRNVLTGYE